MCLTLVLDEPTFVFYDNCTDIPEWMNQDLFISCIDYPYWDEPGCPEYGELVGVDGNITGNEACCYCGGGNECSNLEDWGDSDNYNCTWYIENDFPGCPYFGDSFPNENGTTGNDACCYCQVDIKDDHDYGKVKSFITL